MLRDLVIWAGKMRDFFFPETAALPIYVVFGGLRLSQFCAIKFIHLPTLKNFLKMKKTISSLLAFFLLVGTAAFAQPVAGVNYLITSNLSGLNIVPEGTSLVQSDVDNATAHWYFQTAKNGLFYIKHSKGLYLSAPEGEFSVKKLLLTNVVNEYATWELISAGAKGYQIRNGKNKGFVGNAAKMEAGAPILHFLNPGEGSFWKLEKVETSNGGDACKVLRDKYEAAQKAKDECVSKAKADWRAKNPGKTLPQELAAKFEQTCAADLDRIRREAQMVGCKL